MAPKALVSWSTGKDSAYALHVARQTAEVEVVGVLSTVTASFNRVSMHGVREELLDRQVEELGLPCTKVPIPSPCPNGVYEAAMRRALMQAREQGVTRVVFGDLFLRDIRAYREARLAEVGMRGVFPLWDRDTSALAREMLAAGMRAVITCVDPKRLAPALAGRSFDEELLRELPADVDPCGENGEFHTFVTAGPMFRRSIAVRLGEVVVREGYVFADLLAA
ncbi:MAG: hypothetical protein RMK74_12010 [Myxococcales bacterium]|nr:hypothetical protein [Myxococcales bacterium]